MKTCVLTVILTIRLSICFSQTDSIDCFNKFTRNIDEFENMVRFGSHFNDNINICKYVNIENGSETYYMSLSTIASTISVGKKGVTILFDDKSKMVKNYEKIDIKVNAYGSGYEYYSIINLTKDDLYVLSTKKIYKFRLYIYDEEINQDFAENFKETVSCLIFKKYKH